MRIHKGCVERMNFQEGSVRRMRFPIHEGCVEKLKIHEGGVERMSFQKS